MLWLISFFTRASKNAKQARITKFKILAHNDFRTHGSYRGLEEMAACKCAPLALIYGNAHVYYDSPCPICRFRWYWHGISNPVITPFVLLTSCHISTGCLCAGRPGEARERNGMKKVCVPITLLWLLIDSI